MSEALDTLTELGTTLNNINRSQTPPYFTLISKTISLSTNHINNTIVIDSGAFPMMFNDTKFFTSLKSWNPHIPIQHVTLADGQSQAKIYGIGTVRFLIDKKYSVEFKNTLYVPSFSTHLFSIKEFL